MYYLSQNHKLRSEINIVPLLDVLLVLLLITIATASSITQEIKIDLPDSTQSEIKRINEKDQTVVIEVPEIGQYNIIIGNNRINRLSSEKISCEVQRRMQLNPKTVFLIGGAKNVPYREIIKILSLLHDENVKSVGLMTQSI